MADLCRIQYLARPRIPDPLWPKGWVSIALNGYAGTDTAAIAAPLDAASRVRFHSHDSLLIRYYNSPGRFLTGWTVGGGFMHNPGRYLVLPPTGAANPFNALNTHAFTLNAGDQFDAWDASTTLQILYKQSSSCVNVPCPGTRLRLRRGPWWPASPPSSRSTSRPSPVPAKAARGRGCPGGSPRARSRWCRCARSASFNGRASGSRGGVLRPTRAQEITSSWPARRRGSSGSPAGPPRNPPPSSKAGCSRDRSWASPRSGAQSASVERWRESSAPPPPTERWSRWPARG